MADRDVYWTGAISNAANNLANWQLFDGSPLTHPPGEWEDTGWTVTTHDKLFFLGDRFVRECTNWNAFSGSPEPGVITRGVVVDESYASKCGASYIIGDSGESIWVMDDQMFGTRPDRECILRGNGQLFMSGKWGFSWCAPIDLYDNSDIGFYMNVCYGVTLRCWDGIHVIPPFYSWGGESHAYLMDFTTSFRDDYMNCYIEIHDDAQDEVVPDESVVKMGETFGVGGAKVGTLVVPRRLVGF